MVKKLDKPMKIRDLPTSYARWIHPAYRPLVVKLKKPFSFKRSIAGSIKRKLLTKRMIPRVPPYYCKICTLSTRSFHMVRYHLCSRRNESRHVVSYENEVRIAHLGTRSKAKDCLAVMERLPNPQHVSILNLVVRTAHEIPHGARLQQPQPLRHVCVDALRSKYRTEHVVKEKVLEEKVDAEFAAWRDAKIKRIQKVTHEDMQGDIYACNLCQEYFKTYSDYDCHLLSGPCMDKIRTGTMPSYRMTHADRHIPTLPKSRRTPRKKPKRPISEVPCNGCKKTGWASLDELAEHCVGCTVGVKPPKTVPEGIDPQTLLPLSWGI